MNRLSLCDSITVRSWRRCRRTDEEIATELGCSIAAVRAVNDSGQFCYVPSRSEIARSMSEIRSGWPSAVREDRLMNRPSAGAQSDYKAIEQDAEVQREIKLVQRRDRMWLDSSADDAEKLITL